VRNIFYLFISTFLFLNSLIANEASADSLMNILESENTPDEEKIEILDLLIMLSNQENNYLKAANYAKQAIQISAENKNTGDVVYFSNLCGTANLDGGNYYNALEYYESASKLANTNGWFITRSSILNNIGVIYCYLGDELQGLEYFLEALKIKEENEEAKNLTGALINIGGIYVTMDDFEEGLTFLKRALDNSRQCKDPYSEAKALISIGDLHIKLDNFEEAQNQYYQALSIADSVQDSQIKAGVLTKLGDTFKELNIPNQAFKYYSEALNLSESIDYYFGISLASYELGNYYLLQSDNPNALHFFKMSAVASEKIDASLKIKNSYEALSKVYKKLNKPELALEYYTKYVAIEDSLLRQENQEKYSSIKAMYEADKKQKELDNLRLENEITDLEVQQSKYILYGSLGLTLLILLIVILIFRQQKVRSLQKTIRLEQKLLRSQINPHFIFNALTAVQRFIFEKSTIMASDYLGTFSKLIRFILNSSTVDKISISDEVEFLSNYLSLQAIRFDNKFEYKIIVNDDIEPGTIFIPPMLTQPIVENAVEHGLKQKPEDGLIIINYRLKNKLLQIEIKDNGIGRKKSQTMNAQIKNKHKSLSTSITNERLLHLNKGLNESIRLEYFDEYDKHGEAAGTRVLLNVPIES